MSKKVEYQKAVEFRKRGFTYKEISNLVGVSVSTVSAWLGSEPWSVKIKENNQKKAALDNSKRISLLNKARGNQYKKIYAEVERSAAIEYKHYKLNPLFIAGLMLYVSEGDNTDNHLIRIINSKVDIHKIFIKFAIEFLGVERRKIRFWLLLYPDLDAVTCMKHWSKKTGLSISQFHKNQFIEGRSQKRTLHFGVGNTIIGDTVLKKKLLKWIELATKELNQ